VASLNYPADVSLELERDREYWNRRIEETRRSVDPPRHEGEKSTALNGSYWSTPFLVGPHNGLGPLFKNEPRPCRPDNPVLFLADRFAPDHVEIQQSPEGDLAPAPEHSLYDLIVEAATLSVLIRRRALIPSVAAEFSKLHNPWPRTAGARIATIEYAFLLDLQAKLLDDIVAHPLSSCTREGLVEQLDHYAALHAQPNKLIVVTPSCSVQRDMVVRCEPRYSIDRLHAWARVRKEGLGEMGIENEMLEKIVTDLTKEMEEAAPLSHVAASSCGIFRTPKGTER
jgi:hypothetical protein